MDAYTEVAVKKYFDTHEKMECDKVYNSGSAFVITFTDAESVIAEYNSAYDYKLYMPI